MWEFIRENEAKIRNNIMSVDWTVFNTSFCEGKLYSILEELASNFEAETEVEKEINFDNFLEYLQENADEFVDDEDFGVYIACKENFENWVQNVHEIENVIMEMDVWGVIPEDCAGVSRVLEELSAATRILAEHFAQEIQNEKILKKILDLEYNFLDDKDRWV